MERTDAQATVARLRRLRAALAAGMDLESALRALAGAEPAPPERDALLQAAAHVAAGNRIEAVDAVPGALPQYARALLRAGAVCGTLLPSLDAAVHLFERVPGDRESHLPGLWWEAFGALLDAGVPILQALEVLSDEPFPQGLREAAALLREDVKEGSPLSQAMRRQPEVFGSLECALVASAEGQGKTAVACREIAACAHYPSALAGVTAEPARPAGEPDASEREPAPAGTTEPPVGLLRDLLARAVAAGATEVHIQPQRASAPRVRLRVGDVLQPMPLPDAGQDSGQPWAGAQLVPALKAWAGLDVQETRGFHTATMALPSAAEGAPAHALRVTTYPTALGEAASIAILPRTGEAMSLDALGVAPSQLERLRRLVRQPCGLLVLAGPPHSGRRTTAHAILAEIANPDASFFVLEPAVTREIPGVEHAVVAPELGLTYACALEHWMCHDPDVLYVAEVPDGDTLAACAEAANTGHLVLVRVSAASATDALDALRGLGTDPVLLSACLLGVLAQRSLRLVCPSCSRQDDFTPAERQALQAAGLPAEAAQGQPAARAAGCPECGGTGYRGRTAVFELLGGDDPALAPLLARGAPADELRQCLLASGETLARHAAEKVAAGLTTTEEALRAGMA